jgi:hypothetical protein
MIPNLPRDMPSGRWARSVNKRRKASSAAAFGVRVGKGGEGQGHYAEGEA